jgi:hypothetical protein
MRRKFDERAQDYALRAHPGYNYEARQPLQ